MKFLSDILAKAGLTVDGVVTLNNTATGQTPNANDNSTKLATTAWVRTFVQPYSLPIATAVILGGIKVGTGLSIDAGTGVLSVSGGGAASIKSTQTFTATAGQTVFTISGGYIVGLIDVFLNGVYLSPNQTTATNGTTVTLGDAALAGDIIDVIIASPVYQGATTTTDQLSEGSTNLYFTNARARAAISESVTGLDYNSATGVLSITTGYGIPTTASQTTWDAAYNDKINSAAVTGTTTKTLTLTQQDGGTITASWTDDNTDAVTSVFGRTGAVVAVSGDYTTALVTEVTNLYYTDARARAAISVTGSGSYDSATGIITVTGGVTSVNTLTGAVTLTTTNIGEGTNLYYTTARANSDFDTRLATKSTTNLAEGTNLYYTDTRVGTYLTGNSYATQSYVSTQINNLVSGAPGLLDTLDELAAALGDDPNFATTVSTALGNRLRIDTASQGLNGTQQSNGRTNLGLGSLSTLSSIGDTYITDLAYSKLTGVPSTFAPSAHTHDDRYYTETEIGNFFSGASAITGYNKTNWDTAYGWGNHASGGYLTTASAASTYVSLSGSYANPSWITSLAYSKITGVPAFITSYTEVDTLATVTARGATTSTTSIFTGGLQARKNQTDNNYTTAALWTESFGTTTTGIAFHISGVVGKFLEMRTNGTLYWENNQVWTSGTLTNLNQLTNGPGYVTDLSGYVTLAGVQTITGKKTFSNAFGDSDPVVAFTGTSSASFQYITTAYNASISAGQTIAHFIGRASSSRMSAYIGYQYAAADSNSNFLSLGHWGYDHLIKLYPTGQTIISGAVSASNISSSVTASYIVQRDANGYIYANHVNFSTTESENPVISSFITSNGDGWSRKSSLAHVRSQLGNYGGWITGYTETDTLASVTARGATTTAAITISREAFAYGGTTQSFLISGAAGNGALTINSASAYAYLNFAQAGTTKMEIGIVGTAGVRYGSLYINTNIQVGEAGASIMVKKSNGYVGINQNDPAYQLHITTDANEGIYLKGSGGGVWMNIQSGSGNLWSVGAQTDGMGIYNRTSSLYTFFIKDNRQLQIAGYTSSSSYSGTAAGYLAFDSSGNIITVASVAGTDNTKLPLSGGTMSAGITFSAPGGTVLLKHAVTEVDAWIFQENAANWGLYWKNAPTGHHTFGGYTTVGAELFGMSAANSSGNGVTTTNFVGATSAIAQWMISNFTGYIWSASTIYAQTSMVVGGNTVWHAGNLTNNNQLTNGAGYLTSVGIGNITDAHRFWNNMGNSHSTHTDFNSVSNFGFRYIQGTTNGPGTGSSQFYGMTLGLGNDYAYGTYAMQLAIPRYIALDKYITFRTQEAGSWSAWSKISAGYADTAGSATDSTKLPLTGGSLSGTLNFSQPVGLGFANGQYIKDNGGGGLVIYSGNAININSTGVSVNNNVKITPVSESWAEGLTFMMPSTSTWGGFRWQRQRAGFDGNWAIGYTALDATDDIVFVANNNGAQVNNILRLTKAGAVSMAYGLTVQGVGSFGPDSGADNGVSIRYAGGGYGRVRFYQDGSNHQTIHSFGSAWASSIADSRGAINIDGQYGVTFGGWNAPDGYIVKGGSAWFRYDVTAYSDARVKTDIINIDNAVSKIQSINGVTFSRTDKQDGKRYAGVIAQEVLNILPEVVSQDEQGMYSVSYGNMAGLFIEAIKEQQTQIESQKSEIDELKDLVQQLINR